MECTYHSGRDCFIAENAPLNDTLIETLPLIGEGLARYLRAFFLTTLLTTGFFFEANVAAALVAALPFALAGFTRVRICSCK